MHKGGRERGDGRLREGGRMGVMTNIDEYFLPVGHKMTALFSTLCTAKDISFYPTKRYRLREMPLFYPLCIPHVVGS